MATVRKLIGNIKGPKGDTGATGATGAQGPAGQNGAPGVTDYATTEAAGLVRVGDDFNINSSNGVLSIKNAFTRASALAKMVTDEAFATTLGKIAKAVDWVVDNAPNFFNKNTDIVDGFTSALTDKALSANAGKTLKTQLDSKIDSSKITTSLGVTTTGNVADATVSKVLNDKITTLNNSLTGKLNKTIASTTGSFNSEAIYQFANDALENIRTHIDDYATGIYSVKSNSGPMYGAILYKYSNAYWCVILFSYSGNELCYHAKYTNGQCWVMCVN